MTARVDSGTTYQPGATLRITLQARSCGRGRRAGEYFTVRVWDATSPGRNAMARETYLVRSTMRRETFRLDYLGDGEWALSQLDGTGWSRVQVEDCTDQDAKGGAS